MTIYKFSLHKSIFINYAASLFIFFILLNSLQLQAQVVSINGAIVSVGTGTIITADTINTDGTGTLANAGTLNIASINNNGAITGDGTYNIIGRFVNNNSFTAGASSANFIGTNASATQTIGGTSTTSFNNLTINNTSSAGVVTLLQSVAANTALTIQTGALVLNDNKLTIAGSFSNNSGAGTITGGNSVATKSDVEIGGTGATFNPLKFTSGSNGIRNFYIGRTATLDGTASNGIDLYNTIGFTSSSNTLTTSNNLFLKSTAANAAANVADITHHVTNNTVAITGNTFSGTVAVERFYPARRAWRLVTTPLSAAGSIFDTWQNGGIYQAGKGTFITGPSAAAANGLDISSRNNASLKTGSNYTSVSNTLTTLLSANTSNFNNNADNNAFFIFVRGDRTADNYNTGNSNTTTLRSSGKLQTGNIQFSFLPTDGVYNLVGNPYAAPVDFSKLSKTNLNNTFYTWDPYLNLEQGGYITMTGNPFDATAGYIDVPNSPGGQTNIIQSSQAFFVSKIDATAAASLTFTEPVKSSVGSVAGSGTFRPMNVLEMFRTNLYLINTDGAPVLADGNLIQFDNRYDAGVDKMDAVKFSNTLETFGILVNNTSLSVDKRPSLNVQDTIFFKFTRNRQLKYQFEFIPTNLNPLLLAVLEDSYTGIATPLSISNTSLVNFAVDGNAASQVADRFRIVFSTSKALPVTYTGVKAYQQKNNIVVAWTVENELNISGYEIEKSIDGVSFKKVNTTAAAGVGSGTKGYNWVDVAAIIGDNFYRIKSIDRYGFSQYSQVVKVLMGSQAENMSVYPNPIVDGKIGLQLSNQPKGKYTIQLIDNLGQIVLLKQINHPGGTAAQPIITEQKLISGIYQLEVTKPDNTKTTIKLSVQ